MNPSVRETPRQERDAALRPAEARAPRPSRRQLLRTAGLAAGAALLSPTLASAQTPPRAVARNRTLIVVWGGREGRWVDYELWNPYAIGANHQNGPGILYEPLAYYSAFADQEYPWLAESYRYSPDARELTIKIRAGIKLERRHAVQRRGRGLHPQQPPRPRRQGAMGRGRPAVHAGGPRRGCQHGRDPIQGAVAPILLLHDLQVRHRRLHRAQAHLPGPGLDHIQALRPGQGLAGHHRALEGGLRLAPAEGDRPAGRLVGGKAGLAPMPKVERNVWLPSAGEQRWRRPSSRTRSTTAMSMQPGHHPDRLPAESPGSSPTPARSSPSATWTGGRTPSTSTPSGRRSTTRTSAGRSAISSIGSRSSRSASGEPRRHRPCPCPPTRRCGPTSTRSRVSWRSTTRWSSTPRRARRFSPGRAGSATQRASGKTPRAPTSTWTSSASERAGPRSAP